MRNYLWVLNSFLALLLVGSGLFLWITRPKVPMPETLKAIKTAEAITPLTHMVDPSIIVSRDLFGTEKKRDETKPTVPETTPIPQLPPLPRPVPASVPKPEIPAFLPPLQIILKGVIISQNEEQSRAIIADNKTKEEDLYQVGDTILDAEIVRIFSNKILVIRANGQQETVFISNTDARKDPMYQAIEMKPTETAVRTTGANSYQVDLKLFTQNIKSLAELIDLLDVTTAFENGASVGCRIGAIAPNSIGSTLGLQPGDIVTKINGLPLLTTQNRVHAYESVIRQPEPKSLAVELIRNKQTTTLNYTVSSFREPQKRSETVFGSNNATKTPAQKPKSMIGKFNKDTKDAMLNYGGKEITETYTASPEQGGKL